MGHFVERKAKFCVIVDALFLADVLRYGNQVMKK